MSLKGSAPAIIAVITAFSSTLYFRPTGDEQKLVALTMHPIFHIVSRSDWSRAQQLGLYAPDSLRTQGFIHFSSREQVVRVADFLYRGQDDLLLLEVDADQVATALRYENLDGGEELFPHLYSSLDLVLVKGSYSFPPSAAGTFTLPEELQT